MFARYRYIGFEGIDGAGKSTQLALLATWLERRGVTAIRLFEPTYGTYGQKARKMIAAGRMNQRVELHELLVLDRREHISRKVAPLLQFIRNHAGFKILQDRTYLSAPAYQGADDSEAIRLLKEEQSYAPRADAIILLCVPPALAMGRLRKKADDHLPFKTEAAFAEVQERYNLVARSGTENVLTIDGTGSADDVHHSVLAKLELTHGQSNQ